MEIGIFLLFFIVKNDMIMSDFKYKGEIKMQCPKCGSTNLQSTTETNSTGKDFSASKGCCGAILLGPIGILCGACGKGRKITSTTYWLCSECGNKFKA